jgi:hypothetical protein
MTRGVAVAVLLAGAAARAGDAGFEAFAAKFTLLKPGAFTAKEGGAKLSPDEAIKRVLEPVQKTPSKSLAALRELWMPGPARTKTQALLKGESSDEGETLELATKGRLVLGGVTWLFVHQESSFPAGGSKTVWALAYSGAGALLDGAPVVEELGSEAGASVGTLTLSADGRFTVKSDETRPVHDLKDVDETQWVQTRTGALTPSGAVELSPWTTQGSPGGRFVDPKSKEQLTLVPTAKALRVFYAKKEGAAEQELSAEGDGAAGGTVTVRFKGSKKPYLLSFPKEGGVTCKNPDGTVQSFKAVW